jgi:hypothetical protein
MIILHARARTGFGEWAKQGLGFWHLSYMIGGHSFAITHIDHCCLRGNMNLPGADKQVLVKFLGRKFLKFPKKDSRNVFAVPHPCKELNFAINFGAISCSPMAIYRPETVMQQLKSKASSYLCVSCILCFHWLWDFEVLIFMFCGCRILLL